MVEERIQEWLSRLQASGCRITGPRYILMEILAGADRALTPQELHEIASQRYPSLGLVSVYRTLERLEALDLIQRVHQPEKCQSYIAAFEGHQHLLLCSGCGRVCFFDGDELGGLVRRVERDSGYVVEDHWLQLFGLCEECQTKKDRESVL